MILFPDAVLNAYAQYILALPAGPRSVNPARGCNRCDGKGYWMEQVDGPENLCRVECGHGPQMGETPDTPCLARAIEATFMRAVET